MFCFLCSVLSVHSLFSLSLFCVLSSDMWNCMYIFWAQKVEFISTFLFSVFVSRRCQKQEPIKTAFLLTDYHQLFSIGVEFCALFNATSFGSTLYDRDVQNGPTARPSPEKPGPRHHELWAGPGRAGPRSSEEWAGPGRLG